MPELPVSITMAGQLNACIRGKQIAEVETEHTLHSFAWYEGPVLRYAGNQIGRGGPD